MSNHLSLSRQLEFCLTPPQRPRGPRASGSVPRRTGLRPLPSAAARALTRPGPSRRTIPQPRGSADPERPGAEPWWQAILGCLLCAAAWFLALRITPG